ncbi:MAG TPA: TonB-dependent receptor [Bryobacteraceae bacterium]|nr:TonB-dependent receptor [Bryobacteraceae bacterium]
MHSQRSVFRYLTLLAFALLFVLEPRNVVAQASKSTISGHVTDTTGAVLKGAKVTLEPAGGNVVTDVQGEYFIYDLGPGTYTLTVSYVGFAPFTKTVQVGTSPKVTVDAQLQVQSEKLQVLVTAERPSAEAEAVNEERTADNILQALPADVIRSLPNANMADALGRLPSVTLERDEGEGKYVQIRGTEPRLTNTTVDGMNVPSPESGVRQIKFDAIPADIVQEVQINKTLQANMDGDGIGGSVNLVTKTAQDRPTVSLGGMGGFTPIDGTRGLTEWTSTVGKRFGTDHRLGVLIGGTYDWNGRGIDDIEPVPDIATFPDGRMARTFESMDARPYIYYRSRWGLAGSADYKLGNGSDIYIRGLYSNFKNYGDRNVYSVNDNTPGIQLLGGNGGPPSFNTQDRRPNIGIGSITIGGTHVLTSTWYSWSASVSRSVDINEAPGTAKFDSTLDTSTCQYDPAATKHTYLPQWTPSCYAEAYNLSDYTLHYLTIDHGLTAQLNLAFEGAMGKRYHIGSLPAIFEFGGKFRNAHKFDDTYSDRLDPNSDILLSQFPTSFQNNNFYNGGSYPVGPFIRYQSIRDFANANPSMFALSSTFGGDPANYNLIEKVSAGYLMNTIDFTSRLRLITGIRFEGTSLTTLSFDTTLNTLTDKATGSYVSVLPSASIRYGLTPNSDIRLAYARGLARPDPQDIAQAVTFTNTGSPGSLKNTASLGNPNLKAETADNIDVLYEHYFNGFGMLSAGYFYKNLHDPIATETRILNNFQPSPIAPLGTYTTTQPINAGSAWISGFEASYLQRFTGLPGALRGLGISANYGYTASRASGLPGRSDNPRLLRNAPNTWNISPTFDLGRVSFRIGLSYNQANIYSYNYQDGSDGSDPTPGGLNGPFSDIYFYSHLQFDAEGSVRLTHGLSFVAYGLNLNNEVFGFYQGSPQYMIQREYYQPSIAMGFRWLLPEGK